MVLKRLFLSDTWEDLSRVFRSQETALSHSSRGKNFEVIHSFSGKMVLKSHFLVTLVKTPLIYSGLCVTEL